MKVMSNKSLLGKNTKTKANKNYVNLVSKKRNIAFEISNVKMDKKRKISQIGLALVEQTATLNSQMLLAFSSFNTTPTENHIFMACLDAHLYEIEYTQKEQLNSRESSHLNKLSLATLYTFRRCAKRCTVWAT
jgi:hypothetical protein